ncbi:MAG: hypothetical protein RR835_12580 [Peptostreptococcaceae bacterium]
MKLLEEDTVIGLDFQIIDSEEDIAEIKDLQYKFIQSYISNKDKMSVEDWLNQELKLNLPDTNENEIKVISNDIIKTIKINEKNKESLREAVSNGRSKESWLASQIKKSTSNMAMGETAQYLHTLDEAIKDANKLLHDTITTKSGNINQNFNLDGFLAETHHSNTFNLQAKLKGSEYRAEVLVPKPGQTYAKNSVDIVIKDKSGKIIERYQSKYGKTAEDTIRMINDGNYNNQRLLVPAEQVEEVQKAFPNKTVSSTIGSGDVKSTPLSKSDAKGIQKEAQSGNWNDLNWNEYKTKDLAIGIGKQAGYAAIQGAAIGAGIDVATKVWNGEEIKGEEVVEQALISGADFGIKAAAAGALKVGVEKGIVKVIPKGTPAGIIANIAYVGIENAKIACKVATGELTIQEGMEQMEQTTVSTVAGLAAGAKGTVIGAKIGMVFGPVGAAIGGFIGGTVGYMAGAEVAKTVVKGVQKVREKAKNIIKDTGNYIRESAQNAWQSAKSFGRSLFSW